MNSITYLFLNTENMIYNDTLNKSEANYPQPISNDWPNLPVEFQQNIDDVINLNGSLYFFKGSQYLKFDIAQAQVSDGPRPIADGWPGLRGTGFENGIDAATELTTNTICFFKGKDCIDYTMSSHTANKKTISDRWGTTGKYSGFSENLDAVILWKNITGSMIYLFKGNSYIRYNTKSNAIDGGPTTIQTYWHGVTFNKIQAAVSVDTDLLGSNSSGNCGGTCGTNNTGKYCFQLPQNIKFGLSAYVNTDIHQQTIKVYIDDQLADTLTGKGVNSVLGFKTYPSGTGKVCIEITSNGKPCKLRYAYNTLDAKPGTAIIAAETGTANKYNDSVVVLIWPQA
ncbi:fucose-binding lectin II [Photorhabdus tasmaniensis]|uniref:Photopexin B n=1 Tax=Photorhabdus tasmaniensis TaxID=1004159 RepID=A0ABX0GE82_9GAMM|nr:fucose-binding lectin II [Photorhabdus tasmaniensis]NHB87409.1 photopexin B [Photorhabdus tasmaniensis]